MPGPAAQRRQRPGAQRRQRPGAQRRRRPAQRPGRRTAGPGHSTAASPAAHSGQPGGGPRRAASGQPAARREHSQPGRAGGPSTARPGASQDREPGPPPACWPGGRRRGPVARPALGPIGAAERLASARAQCRARPGRQEHLPAPRQGNIRSGPPGGLRAPASSGPSAAPFPGGLPPRVGPARPGLQVPGEGDGRAAPPPACHPRPAAGHGSPGGAGRKTYPHRRAGSRESSRKRVPDGLLTLTSRQEHPGRLPRGGHPPRRGRKTSS